MTKQQVTSSKRKWIIRIFFVVIAYVGLCAGTARYMKKSAQKVLHRMGIKENQAWVHTQYLPFPVLTIDWSELAYKKISLQGNIRFSPCLPGIFSGRYVKMVIDTTFKGDDLTGFYQEQMYFSPKGLSQQIPSFKSSQSTLEKIKTWFNFLQKIKNITGSSKGGTTFKTYQSTFHADVPTSGSSDLQFEVREGKEEICRLTIQSGNTKKAQDTHFRAKADLLLRPEVLRMSNALSHCITGQKILTPWLLENQSHIQELFLPLTLSFDAKGHGPTEKLAAVQSQLAAPETDTDIAHLSTSIERLKKFAVLPLDFTVHVNVSATETAKAQGKFAIKQSLEAQNKNKLSCDIDLEWSSLLAHFAKYSPKSYQNAEKLFAFSLKLINKNKEQGHISTHVYTTYDANTLAVEDFTINGMPFGQLLQAFFSNPDMHKHLQTK